MSFKRKTSVRLEFERVVETAGSPGDSEAQYAGAVAPCNIRTQFIEGVCDFNTPETLMIWKERWNTVSHLVMDNPKLSPFHDWLLDHFSGYTFVEIAERHGVTRQIAFHRVNETIEYLRKKIRGKQF